MSREQNFFRVITIRVTKSVGCYAIRFCIFLNIHSPCFGYKTRKRLPTSRVRRNPLFTAWHIFFKKFSPGNSPSIVQRRINARPTTDRKQKRIVLQRLYEEPRFAHARTEYFDLVGVGLSFAQIHNECVKNQIAFQRTDYCCSFSGDGVNFCIIIFNYLRSNKWKVL